MSELMPVEITFNSLDENVKQALRLLWKVRDKAVNGVGCHKETSCPIACGYFLDAKPRWSSLTPKSKDVLIQADWTEYIYNSFISWYDFSMNLLSMEEFLRKFLQSDSLPTD